MNSYETEFDMALHQSIACAQKYMASLQHLRDIALRVEQSARYSEDKVQLDMRKMNMLHKQWQEVQQNRRYLS